ncbi:hypothetical protein, partial [Acinetobacter baumannii]
MKIIPEQTTSLIQTSNPRIRVDTGAFCFFVLGMFLAAMMGEFKHEVRQFQKPYDNQQAEQISLM